MSEQENIQQEVTAESLSAEVQVVTGSETETASSSTPELSEPERKAYEMGWRPKEEYQGQHFVPAEEYINRAPLFERIERQSKEIRDLKDLVKQSTTYLTTLRKDAYEKAIQDLEKQQKVAEDSGDIQQFKMASIEAQSLKSKMQSDPMIQAQPSQVPQEVHPEALSFMERNKTWYNNSTPENKLMVDTATQIEQLVRLKADQKGEVLSPKEILNRVERSIKLEFPERFSNMNRNAPSAVGKSTTSVGTSGSTGLSRFLTPAQREIGEHFQRSNKELTLEKYAEALDAAGRLTKK